MSRLCQLIINFTLKVSVRVGLCFIMPSLGKMFDFMFFLNIIRSLANNSHFMWLAVEIYFASLHKMSEKIMF